MPLNLKENFFFCQVYNYMEVIPQFNPKDFEIVKQLGSGSFGQVYLVKNRRTNKLYAVKEAKSKNIKNSFEKEMQTYQKTSNAAVLSLLGYSSKNFKSQEDILSH